MAVALLDATRIAAGFLTGLLLVRIINARNEGDTQ